MNKIQHMSRGLYRATEIVPNITRGPEGTWELTLDAPRVHLSVMFASSRKWQSATLTVDGKPVPWGTDAHDIARIIADPDSHLALTPDEDDPNLPAFVDTDASAAPSDLRAALAMVPESMAEQLSIRVGRRGQSRWAIRVESDRSLAEVGWARVNGRWSRDLKVIVDGKDVSGQVGNDMAKALGMVLPGSDTPPPLKTAPGDPQVTPTGVRTRRQTVIRV